MAHTLSAFLLVLLCAATPAWAQGFKFSQPSADEQAQEAERQRRDAQVADQLAAPCRDRIRSRKIMVLVAEDSGSGFIATQSGFGRHVEEINNRLQALGLKTYSAEQIRKQVAQEEVDAYFKNDPDRALSASRRLAAQYVLRGVIATQARRNAIANVNQVDVAMDFTLADAGGRALSTVSVKDASYAGADTAGMALALVRERAAEVVARLYSDYCQKAR